MKVRGRKRMFSREAALQAAAEEFGDMGYDAASVSALTAAMGIARPSMYACFGSKEELFREVLKKYIEESAAMFNDSLFSGSALEGIERLLCGCIQAFTSPSGSRVNFLTQRLIGKQETSEAI